MILNGSCTIIRADESGNYAVKGIYPCMWQETEAYEVKKYGEASADKAAVYIPEPDADIEKGDYIVRGALDFPEITAALAVQSVTRYDYGSPALRHIKVGAR